MTCGKEETSHLTCWTKSGGKRENGREKERERRKEKKGEEKMSEKLQLLSRILGDRTFGSRRSKRQSWSTQRELRVGTKICRFCQTPRGKDFSPTRFNSCLRSIQLMKCLGSGRPCSSVPEFWD